MAFFTTLQGSTGSGGANLRDPRGGLAKGTPRKTATGFSNPSKLTYFPRTLPCFVSTTGGEDECPDGQEIMRTHQRGKIKPGFLVDLVTVRLVTLRVT